jgi:predicted RNase H-like HicB family nuclease
MLNATEAQTMSGQIIVVKAARDAEAGVWFVESSDLPGLNLEADTLEALAEKLPGAILDLLEAGGDLPGGGDAHDVPVELIAHASTRVRIAAA